MFRIINSILILGLVSLFAGNGGHSFGGEKNSEKFGSKRLDLIERKLNIAPARVDARDCKSYININTKSSVRYKNWFYLLRAWKSGYATTTTTQCNKAINVSRLQIDQYATVQADPYNTRKDKVGTTIKINTNFVKHTLKNEDIDLQMHTVHSVKYGDKSAHVNLFNDWGGILNEVTGNKSIFSW